MPLPEALRGEVWDVDFPDYGEHPAVVLSMSMLNVRLGHVVVVPVTGTAGPVATHVALGPDAGLTGYPEPYADITTVQPVDRTCLLTRRGLLVRAELQSIAQRVRLYLEL